VSREGNGGGAALALPHLVAGRAQRRRRGATGSAMRRAAPGVDSLREKWRLPLIRPTDGDDVAS
jgi:hypothetical protein